jgi:hypothetical protein
MNNLNVGALVSSVLAMTSIGVYVYMNNDDTPEHVHNEYVKEDTDLNDVSNSNEFESDQIKNHKKSVTIKTKRRATKNTGTRRKR